MTTQTKPTARLVALALYQGHIYQAPLATCANPAGFREVGRARIELTQAGTGDGGEYTNAAPLHLVVGERHGPAIEILSYAIYPERNADVPEPDAPLYAAAWPGDAQVIHSERELQRPGPHARLSAGGSEFEIPAGYLVVPSAALAAE